MWSAIAAIVAAIASGIRLASEWMARKREELLISLGQKNQQAKDLQERINAINEGIIARERARAELNRNADRLSDDGFQRRDEDD
jgi:hypothetical protein